MKTLLTAAVSLLVAAGCGGAPRADADFSALAQRHDRAWNDHDPEAMVALFAPEFSLVTPSGTRVEDRAALRAMLAQPSPTNQTTSTTRFEGVHWLADDLVLLDGVQTLEGPGVEHIGSSRARVVAIAQRDEDGWQLLAVRPQVIGAQP